MRQTESLLEYFVFFVLGPLIFFVGLIGNTLGLIIFIKGNLKTFGPVHMYRYLFIFDSAALIAISNYYFIEGFFINFIAISSLSCRVFGYFTFAISAISPMILVYILFERLLSIKFPVESNFLRNPKTQKIYMTVLIMLNLLLFIEVPFTYSLTSRKYINSTCKFISSTSRKRSSLISLVNKIFVPFSLMLLISVVLL